MIEYVAYSIWKHTVYNKFINYWNENSSCEKASRLFYIFMIRAREISALKPIPGCYREIKFKNARDRRCERAKRCGQVKENQVYIHAAARRDLRPNGIKARALKRARVEPSLRLSSTTVVKRISLLILARHSYVPRINGYCNEEFRYLRFNIQYQFN